MGMIESATSARLLKQKFIDDLCVGETHTALVSITTRYLESLSGVSGDDNIIHQRYVHGALLPPLISGIFFKWLGSSSTRILVFTHMDADFLNMIPVGKDVRIEIELLTFGERTKSRCSVRFSVTGICNKKKVLSSNCDVLVPYRNRG